MSTFLIVWLWEHFRKYQPYIVAIQRSYKVTTGTLILS